MKRWRKRKQEQERREANAQQWAPQRERATALRVAARLTPKYEKPAVNSGRTGASNLNYQNLPRGDTRVVITVDPSKLQHSHEKLEEELTKAIQAAHSLKSNVGY